MNNSFLFHIISSILSLYWFWFNYLLLLVITLPFSLLEITVNGEKVRSVPLWECYLSLLKGKISSELVIVISIHLFLTFAICFIIWAFIYKPASKNRD